jgi:hypothetical protein
MTAVRYMMGVAAALYLLYEPAAAQVDTEPWARVLAQYCKEGGLQYAPLQRDRVALDAFVGSLASAEPERMSEAEQLAFWINAYNAVAVHHVLERYPRLTTVKQVDGFFDRLTLAVAGRDMTLDEIERRGRDLDVRVHFAVACASASCPDLRAEPYIGARIDQQLEDQTRRFLANTEKGLAYDEPRNTLWLSPIFKWYAGDFTGGSTVLAFFARGKVVGWILPQLPDELGAKIRDKDPAVRYLSHDWSLNDRSADRAARM